MIGVCVDITVAVVTSVPFKVHPTNNTPLSNQLLSLFYVPPLKLNIPHDKVQRLHHLS